METKKKPSGERPASLVSIPFALFSVLTVVVVILRFTNSGAVWLDGLAWAAAWLAAVSPGMLLILIPAFNRLFKAADGYHILQAATVEGVGEDTLNRCAAIAEAQSGHPIAACLRAYCGDVAVPPDKFVEMEGLGASAQFSGQMIHAGSADYLRGLKIDVPDVPGRAAYVALEGRLLGYYRLLGPSETAGLKKRILCALAVCAALKLTVWAALALAGTDHLTVFVGCETASLVAGLITARRFSS